MLSSAAMSNVILEYSKTVTTTQLRTQPVIIIGQLRHLKKASFTSVRSKLEPYVREEDYVKALQTLRPSGNYPLFQDLAVLSALPFKSSRHNTPSRAHGVTKHVKSASCGTHETVVLVCERQDAYASACAVARAYPLFTRKSTVNSEPVKVRVEFVLVPSADPPEEGPITNGSIEDVEPLSDEDVQLFQNAGTAVRMAARIVDAPCSEMNVDNFVQEILNVKKELDVKGVVIRGEELREKGFGGIYGVGKAAVVPPALVVLSHLPEGATQTIAWVGKGIVYDTGGLSIKGKTTMPGMKRDCGGAAGVLGAFYLAVKSGFTENLHAVFCLAENAVGPNATRPDDIHTLYSGKCVFQQEPAAMDQVIIEEVIDEVLELFEAVQHLDFEEDVEETESPEGPGACHGASRHPTTSASAGDDATCYISAPQEMMPPATLQPLQEMTPPVTPQRLFSPISSPDVLWDARRPGPSYSPWEGPAPALGGLDLLNIFPQPGPARDEEHENGYQIPVFFPPCHCRENLGASIAMLQQHIINITEMLTCLNVH